MHLQIALSSDEGVFGGWENVSKKYDTDYQTQEVYLSISISLSLVLPAAHPASALISCSVMLVPCS